MNVLKTMAVASVALLIGMPGALGAAGAPDGISTGMGNGANLGGLAGVDAHCTKLAEADGSKGCSWHACLSTQEKANVVFRRTAGSDRGHGTTQMES